MVENRTNGPCTEHEDKAGDPSDMVQVSLCRMASCHHYLQTPPKNRFKEKIKQA